MAESKEHQCESCGELVRNLWFRSGKWRCSYCVTDKEKTKENA